MLSYLQRGRPDMINENIYSYLQHNDILKTN